MLTTKSNCYTFQKSGIWYFSRRVPSDLRRHYRTGRIAYSLRTKSIRDARVRAVNDAAKLKTKEYRIHCAPRKYAPRAEARRNRDSGPCTATP